MLCLGVTGNQVKRFSMTLCRIPGAKGDPIQQTGVAEQTLLGVDLHVLFRLLIRGQLLIRLAQINLREDLATLEGTKQILHFGNGVALQLGYRVNT